MAYKKECAAMLAWLKNRHAALKQLEESARQSLDAGDVEAYRAKMRARAENLAAIHEAARDLLAELPARLAAPLDADLQGFARGAENALGLDSIFYMSALLYPDDHKPGEPDNLERCIARFESGAADACT